MTNPALPPPPLLPLSEIARKVADLTARPAAHDDSPPTSPPGARRMDYAKHQRGVQKHTRALLDQTLARERGQAQLIATFGPDDPRVREYSAVSERVRRKYLARARQLLDLYAQDLASAPPPEFRPAGGSAAWDGARLALAPHLTRSELAGLLQRAVEQRNLPVVQELLPLARSKQGVAGDEFDVPLQTAIRTGAALLDATPEVVERRAAGEWLAGARLDVDSLARLLSGPAPLDALALHLSLNALPRIQPTTPVTPGDAMLPDRVDLTPPRVEPDIEEPGDEPADVAEGVTADVGVEGATL